MNDMSLNREYAAPGWLALLAENYGLVAQGEPVLLNQRDGQRVYRLNTREGATLTVRLCSSSQPYERVLAAAQGLLYLTKHHFAAPTLRLTVTGQPLFSWQAGSWAYVHDFIEGEHPAWDLSLLREVAGLLGRLHVMATGSEPYPARVDWLDDLARAVARAQSYAADPQWGSRIAEVAATLQNLPDLRGLPAGLTHGDLHEGNLLRTPAGQLYLLDWEHAGMGELILDLGMVLGWHCLWPATRGPEIFGDFDFDSEWCRTFLAAYQQQRLLTYSEAHHLGAAIRFVTGWYAVRDIIREIEQPGSSEGLASFHYAVTLREG